MINNLKKFFHTDKWWGKTIFVVITYIIFWCVFYGSLFLIPDSFFEIYNIPGFITIIYAILIVPFISFYLNKFFQLKKNIFYIINTIFIILSLMLFFAFLIIGAINNYSGF